MDKKIDFVLKRIEELERTKPLGSVPRSSGSFLNMLVLATKSKNILELGCSVGYSAIWMAAAAKELGGHVYTIDISETRIKMAKDNFVESGLDEYITLFEKDIISVLSDWGFGDIDFVFIDAEKNEYLKYYELVLPLLKKGGLIIADDVGKFKDEVKPFIDKVSNDSSIISQFLEFDDGLMLIYKK